MKPESEADLARRLEQNAINFRGWGVDEGTKPLASLWEEVRLGECQLELREGRPVRVVRLAGVDVLCDGCHLVEVEQRFHDGRGIRRRNLETSLAEKLAKDEKPVLGARRGLAEEVGLTIEVPLESRGTLERAQPSESYPGLPSLYKVHYFRVDLAPEQKSLVRLEERQKDKTTFFAWRPIEEPETPSGGSVN